MAPPPQGPLENMEGNERSGHSLDRQNHQPAVILCIRSLQLTSSHLYIYFFLFKFMCLRWTVVAARRIIQLEHANSYLWQDLVL